MLIPALLIYKRWQYSCGWNIDYIRKRIYKRHNIIYKEGGDYTYRAVTGTTI